MKENFLYYYRGFTYIYGDLTEKNKAFEKWKAVHSLSCYQAYIAAKHER